jgi:hypothetical protein
MLVKTLRQIFTRGLHPGHGGLALRCNFAPASDRDAVCNADPAVRSAVGRRGVEDLVPRKCGREDSNLQGREATGS